VPARIVGVLSAGSVALVWTAVVVASSAPPRMGFTANVRADAAETSSGQNEPQVTVDQSGTAYVTWQSGENGSDVSRTKDGTHFTYLGYPDPATPNTGIGTGDIGDVTLSRSYVATSTDGGNTFGSHKANTDNGTHYFPWVAAGGNGGVDVVYYDTPYVEGVGLLNKPAAAPSTAQWTVQLSQSLDGGTTWTQSPVSSHPIYFGDISTTGIFCGLAPDSFNWGNDRILFDDFGVAVGPDGGARVTWTDAHDSWTDTCKPGGDVSCQTTHVEFACQQSGKGVAGQDVKDCGRSGPAKLGR
jgi:hypothetical protein